MCGIAVERRSVVWMPVGGGVGAEQVGHVRREDRVCTVRRRGGRERGKVAGREGRVVRCVRRVGMWVQGEEGCG